MIIFKKARSPDRTLNDLDSYLKSVGTEPIKLLAREVQSWSEFSYDELADLIADGRLDDYLDWQARYSALIAGTLAPLWSEAITAASKAATKGKVVLYDSNDYVRAWIETHGGELITQLSRESQRAVAMVIMLGQSQRMASRDIAKQVRPLIGLTQNQATANLNYREKVYNHYREQGMGEVKARERADKAAIRYAGKQHRFRAETIAHTELAFAYNRGAHMGVSQGIAEGLMGRCAMKWSTAGTNRVCSRCLALKDTIVGYTDESGVTLPPLHPRCRCAIIYDEVAAPRVIKPKDFKTEIATLRQELATQRAQGASAAEIEKTIKAAGQLVASEVKKTKIYDLPPEQKIDLAHLQSTCYDFTKRIMHLPRRTSAEFNLYQELISIRDKMLDELWALEDAALNETAMIQQGRAEQLKRLLSQVRAMGASKAQLKAQFGTSRTEARKIFDVALNYYPTDWVEASINRGVLKAQKPKSGRAYYWKDIITVMPNAERRIGTAVHELGHRMEDVVREILDSEKEFYRRRTAGESLERLRDVTGNSGYDFSELTRKDKFLEAYMGKDYGGTAFELVSMGFQYAYTDPARLLQDEDFAEWIYGLLAMI